MKYLRVLALPLFLLATLAQGQVDATQQAKVPKSKIWVFSFIGVNHNLVSPTGSHKLRGLGSAVQVGYGHVAEGWFTTLNLDVHSGPFKLNQSGSDLNFFGTGVSSEVGWSLNGGGLRSPTLSYGLGFGLNYFDIVGRPNLDDTKLVMRVNDFALMPCLFLAKLSPPRFEGNTPEQLMTRIEGYMLNLGILVPILATYDQKIVDSGSGGTKRVKGRLGGFSVVMHLSTWLGI
jgi:hypothetical protein